jgi:hypothetical protein
LTSLKVGREMIPDKPIARARTLNRMSHHDELVSYEARLKAKLTQPIGTTDRATWSPRRPIT